MSSTERPVRIEHLRTPAALVDLPALERNAARMAGKASRLGVALRPHVKTHKCVEIARLQTRGHSGAITVSTLAEARAFHAAGFTDITYAVPVPLPAVPEAAELMARGCSLNLLLDGEAALAGLEAFSASRPIRFPLFLKVDCGYHRAGVDPEREESVAFARRLSRSPAVSFRGILTHAGHAYRCGNREEAARVAAQERDLMVSFASRLRAAGIEVPAVSVGSTPTCCAVEGLPGVTEMRPGNYAFFDAFQAAIGTCAREDALAFTVLTTVIGHYPARGEMLLNAGALALSKDEGARHVDPACGFGLLCDASGAFVPGLRLAALSQEHGQVSDARAEDFARFPVGSLMRVVPNHSCLAAACFDRYHVVRGGEVTDEWRTVRGW